MEYRTEPYRQYKLYFTLAAIYITVQLACNILVYKIVSLGSIFTPASAIIFTIDYAFGDIIAEVYGYQLARQLIWLNILCQYLFAVLLTIGIHLPSPDFWKLQSSYDVVFGNAIRQALGSTVAVVASAFINAYIISKTKIMLKGKYFWLRCLTASGIAEGTLVAIAYMTIFIGKYSVSYIFIAILTAWGIKLVCSAIFSLPAAILTRFLKLYEGIDIYDIRTNFNPFSLKINSK